MKIDIIVEATIKEKYGKWCSCARARKNG